MRRRKSNGYSVGHNFTNLVEGVTRQDPVAADDCKVIPVSSLMNLNNALVVSRALEEGSNLVKFLSLNQVE